MSKSESDLFVYNQEKSTFNIDKIENKLNNENINEILEYFKSNFTEKNKNRFFIKNAAKNKNKTRKIRSFLNR